MTGRFFLAKTPDCQYWRLEIFHFQSTKTTAQNVTSSYQNDDDDDDSGDDHRWVHHQNIPYLDHTITDHWVAFLSHTFWKTPNKKLWHHSKCPSPYYMITQNNFIDKKSKNQNYFFCCSKSPFSEISVEGKKETKQGMSVQFWFLFWFLPLVSVWLRHFRFHWLNFFSFFFLFFFWFLLIEIFSKSKTTTTLRPFLIVILVRFMYTEEMK